MAAILMGCFLAPKLLPRGKTFAMDLKHAVLMMTKKIMKATRKLEERKPSKPSLKRI